MLDKLTYSGNRANLDGVDHEFHEGDIVDPSAVASAGRDCAAIVNFAAETHVDRSILGATDFGRTEFFGTQVLLEHVRATGARFVQVSTDEVYGDLADGGSAREDDPIRPSSPYSVAKAAGDLHVPAYARTFGVDASITRGSNTYGPNQYPEKLIPLFTTNALDGEPLPLYGDGRQVRDWLHVDDHCAGIELVLREGKAGEIYNVGGGEEVENRAIAASIVELTGADPGLLRSVEDRPGHDRRYSLDSGKLRGARLANNAHARGRPARDGGVVPREPRLVGADQVGRVPRVLRAPVREASRLTTRDRGAKREGDESDAAPYCGPRLCPARARRGLGRRARAGGSRAGHELRLRGPRLRARDRDEPVRRARLRAARLHLRADPRPLLPRHDARLRARRHPAGAARRGQEDAHCLLDRAVHGRRRHGREPFARRRARTPSARDSRCSRCRRSRGPAARR